MVSLTHEQNIICSQIQLDDMAHEQTIICRSRGRLSANEKEEKFASNDNYAPINGLPQDGGAGQPTGNLTFSGFQMSISPPLGLHCKSNSHPWGPLTFIVSSTE